MPLAPLALSALALLPTNSAPRYRQTHAASAPQRVPSLRAAAVPSQWRGPAFPHAPSEPPNEKLASPNLASSPPPALSPLFDFSGTAAPAQRQADLEAWERIDDVIMGGVSSSRLVLDDESAVFEGRVREQGGGFCGQRMRLLSEPMDLSDSEGIFVECEAATDVGPDPATKRVWKMALRTKQDRGEVVYQCAFAPPTAGRAVVRLPFSGFRLVRGPRLVPGVPPLSAAQTNATFQMSLVVSKFTVSEDGSALTDFEEGPFQLKLWRVGTFGAAASAAVAKPRALTETEQRAAAPLPVRLLRPVLGALFGEAVRRRNAATKLLEARGTSRLQRAKLAWSWRAAGKSGVAGALRKSTAAVARDALALVLSLPIKLLFRSLVLGSRAIKALRGVAARPAAA